MPWPSRLIRPSLLTLPIPSIVHVCGGLVIAAECRGRMLGRRIKDRLDVRHRDALPDGCFERECGRAKGRVREAAGKISECDGRKRSRALACGVRKVGGDCRGIVAVVDCVVKTAGAGLLVDRADCRLWIIGDIARRRPACEDAGEHSGGVLSQRDFANRGPMGWEWANG